MSRTLLISALILWGCGTSSHEPKVSPDAGNRAPGTGGSVTGTGGAIATGGSITGTGGSVAGTGGSVAAGGSAAGTGGAPPQAVVPCDSAKGGVWEDVTPPGVRAHPAFSGGTGYGVNAFVIDPSNTANVTLGTDHLGVYRTTDCGATWTHVNTGKNGDVMDGGTQWTMAIDPVDPKVIYSVSGYGTHGVFKTTNGGVDWEQTLAPEFARAFVYDGFTAQVRIDPTDHEHVVITPHFTCQSGHSETCFLQTRNGGKTWDVVENTPSSGEGARLTIINENTWFSALGFGGLFRTDDGGQSWDRVTAADSYAYEVFHPAGGKYYLPAAFGVAVSDDGVAWKTLAGSPGAHVVTTSTTRLYASTGSHCVVGHDDAFHPITSARLDDPEKWTVDESYSNRWGSGELRYDPDHHILYSSNCLGGFWRVRTE